MAPVSHVPGRSSWTLVAACFASAILAAWFSSGSASGQQAAGDGKIEYNVVSVDANALAARLPELGNQGWEVVTITISEQKFDGGATPPKVIAEKYDVTCRKPAKR